MTKVTTFAQKHEITTPALAAEWVQAWERKLKTLPSSAPKKMRAQYEAKLREAREHLASFA